MTAGRIFRIVFVVVACVSLLVNAVLLGIGARLANEGVIGQGMLRAVADLPRDTRRAFRDSLRADRATLRALRQDLNTKRRAMIAIAGERPVDSAALRAAMQDVRTATTRLQQAAHDAILKTAK